MEWEGAIIGKGSGVASVVTTGETITTLNRTVEVASTLERFAGTTLHIGEELFKAAVPPATAVDVFAHFGCYASQNPDSAFALTTAPN